MFSVHGFCSASTTRSTSSRSRSSPDSQVRVVVSARSDPPLPLHRWRAGGRLSELRASELRMAPPEVAQFVRAVGVDASLDDAAVLTERTEGWAAGVQLAALSMRHEADP